MKSVAMDCGHARHLIERLFVHRDPALFPRVHAHIGECEECRELYNSLFDAEAALGQLADEKPRVLCAPEKMLIRSVVMSRSTDRRGWRRGLLISLVAAAAVSAATLLFFMIPRDQEHGRDTFMARTGGASGEALAPTGIRMFCLSTSQGKVKVSPVSTAPLRGEPPACAVRDRLGFAVWNELKEPCHLLLITVGPDGRSQVAFPATGASGVLPRAKDETPLDTTLALGTFGEGRLHLYAFFSQRELPAGPLLELTRGRPTTAALSSSGASHVVHAILDTRR